jgi:hypothetical protein
MNTQLNALNTANVILVVGNMPAQTLERAMPDIPKLRLVKDDTPELLEKEILCCVMATD